MSDIDNLRGKLLQQALADNTDWPVEAADALVSLRARLQEAEKMLAQRPFDVAKFEIAPCYLCGYNGLGYYQPDKHRCAAKYHAAISSSDSTEGA